MPTTISFYIGRIFIVWVGIVFSVLIGLVALFETVELLRRAANRPEATLDLVLQMTALKLPHLSMELIPFAVLFGGMIAFWRLTRSNELIVCRAVGVSAWQFMGPAILGAFLLGVAQVGFINPLSAAMLSAFEKIEAKILKGQSSMLNISDTGLWLRQPEITGNSVIRASRMAPDEVVLYEVTIFQFEGVDRFTRRLDADRAALEDGFWVLNDVWITGPQLLPRQELTLRIPTTLTFEKIQDSFASPETMSFWELPGFIALLEESGFSAAKHRMQWYKLLSTPFLLCAIVLIAVPFSLRAQRRGGVLATVFLGVLSGFLLFLMSQALHALGEGEQLPALLAAWTPAGVSSMLGVAILLHQEDG